MPFSLLSSKFEQLRVGARSARREGKKMERGRKEKKVIIGK